MAMKLAEILLAGLETTRGTAAGSTPLHLPVIMPGFVPTTTAHVATVEASSTFPDVTDQVEIGVTTAFNLSPQVNRDTVRDILLWATKWVDGARPSLTLARKATEEELFLGAIVTQLVLSYARSAAPGDEAILHAEISGECMKRETTTGLSAGTQAVARSFPMQRAVFTVNDVAVAVVLSYRHTIELAAALGPPDDAGKRLYLEDGIIRHSIEMTAKFAAAHAALIRNQTQHAVTILHATGTANETVSMALGKTRLKQLGEADDNGMVTMSGSWVAAHTGSVAAMVPTFGSSIGATVLGL